MDLKIELAKTITRRRKAMRRINVLTEQTRIQQGILADVCQDMQACGYETARLEQVIAVLKKVEIVLAQESAKL